jgi:hypothetical protein
VNPTHRHRWTLNEVEVRSVKTVFYTEVTFILSDGTLDRMFIQDFTRQFEEIPQNG